MLLTSFSIALTWSFPDNLLSSSLDHGELAEQKEYQKKGAQNITKKWWPEHHKKKMADRTSQKNGGRNITKKWRTEHQKKMAARTSQKNGGQNITKKMVARTLQKKWWPEHHKKNGGQNITKKRSGQNITKKSSGQNITKNWWPEHHKKNGGQNITKKMVARTSQKKWWPEHHKKMVARTSQKKCGQNVVFMFFFFQTAYFQPWEPNKVRNVWQRGFIVSYKMRMFYCKQGASYIIQQQKNNIDQLKLQGCTLVKRSN